MFLLISPFGIADLLFETAYVRSIGEHLGASLGDAFVGLLAPDSRRPAALGDESPLVPGRFLLEGHEV